MEINYLLCGDKNCIKPMCVSIVSTIINNIDVINNFYIFCYDFDVSLELKQIEKKYKNICKIKLINTSKYNHYFEFQDISKSTNKWISKASYLRILAFKILPKNVNKIIYLDCDLIINDNLKDIYKFDQKKLFKAVAEQSIIKKKQEILFK